MEGLDGVRCFKKRKYKTKTYKIKKSKSVQRPLYSSTRSTPSNTSSVSADPKSDSGKEVVKTVSNDESKSSNKIEVVNSIQSEREPISNNTEINIQPIQVDNEITKQKLSDPPLKNQNIVITTDDTEKENNTQNASPQPRLGTQSQISSKQSNNVTETLNSERLKTTKPNLTFTFRDEKINVSEGYSFNELIHFVINQDELLEPEEAFEQLKDLSDLLKKHPQIQVTITANTATDEPHPSHKYGGDDETLTSMWETKTDSTDQFTSLKQLMIARAQRIEELLVQNGVNPNQLTYELGTHNMWKYQRYVTFNLNDGK